MNRTVIALLGAVVIATGSMQCGGSGEASSAPTPTPNPNPNPTGTIRADHTSLNADNIPQSALDQARARTMLLSHASVGGNIWNGLTQLQAGDRGRYALPNWKDNNRGNPGWQAKVDNFETYVASNLASYDVFQNKLCYIDQHASFTYYRDSMLKLEGRYPAKKFIWWTIPLMTTGGDNALRAAFNQSVRTYCAQNNKILYDIAAIESHRANGEAVTNGGNEALAAEWTSDGGHLNAEGSARAAKAMWWLMARLAGWSGN